MALKCVNHGHRNLDRFVAIRTLTTFTNSFTYVEQNYIYFIPSGATGWAMEGWKMRKVLARFLKDEAGATAIEYGLIAAGISVAECRRSWRDRNKLGH